MNKRSLHYGVCGEFGWVGVSCSLFPTYIKPIPTHEKKKIAVGKSGPNATFITYFLLGWVGLWVGLWVGEFDGVIMLIRAKRVSNCYIPPKKSVICACVVCSTNLGFSGEKNCTYVPGISRLPRYVYDTRYVFCTRYVCTWYQPADERCLLYTSPSPRDKRQSRMPSSA